MLDASHCLSSSRFSCLHEICLTVTTYWKYGSRQQVCSAALYRTKPAIALDAVTMNSVSPVYSFHFSVSASWCCSTLQVIYCRLGFSERSSHAPSYWTTRPEDRDQTRCSSSAFDHPSDSTSWPGLLASSHIQPAPLSCPWSSLSGSCCHCYLRWRIYFYFSYGTFISHYLGLYCFSCTWCCSCYYCGHSDP